MKSLAGRYEVGLLLVSFDVFTSSCSWPQSLDSSSIISLGDTVL